MSQVDAVEKSYNDLSTSIARLKAAGYDEQEILKLDPTSFEFQEAQKEAMRNARMGVEAPVNTNESEVSPWYKRVRNFIQSSSRVLIMSLIELVRGLFPFTVMIALIIADGVRLFHSINLLTKDNGIAALLAVVGILAYILLVYRKSEASYNFVGSNDEYHKWSLGLVLQSLSYRLSTGGGNFKPQTMGRAENEYLAAKRDVYRFKMLMFALIVLSPLMDTSVTQALFSGGALTTNFLSGQTSATQGLTVVLQSPFQIILGVFLNAFLTIQFLSMLDSNISRAYALYADRDGDQARGQGYFLEQQRLYRVEIDKVGMLAQAAFLKQRQQQAKLLLAQITKEAEAKQLAASNPTSSTSTLPNLDVSQPSQTNIPVSPTVIPAISPVYQDLGAGEIATIQPNQGSSTSRTPVIIRPQSRLSTNNQQTINELINPNNVTPTQNNGKV